MADTYGDNNDNTLVGTVFNDNIFGLGGNDTITGDAGYDAIWGGSGDDSIDGGDGNDSVAGEGGNDTIIGGSGNDSLYGDGAHDSLMGGEGNDVLSGGSGNDTLIGGEGDDNLISGTGAERFIIEDATKNGNDVIDGFNFYADKIDATALSGYSVNVTVVSASMIVIDWGVSGNSITLTNLVDDANTWTDNILFGTTFSGAKSGVPTLDGTVDGTGLAEVMIVGYTDAGGDTIGNSGDTIEANGGNDTVSAGTGDDDIEGGAGNDSIVGNAGDDTIDGGDDDDVIFGSAGDDRLVGGDGADTIDGGDDADRLDGEAGADSLSGGAGNDTIDGGDDNDVIAGDAGDDSIDGGDGNDTIDGGDDADTIDGGAGDDSMDGGAGADTFVLDYSANGDDTVSGFVIGTDTIDASAITAASGTISVTEAGGNLTITWGVAGNSMYIDSPGGASWDLTMSQLFGTTYSTPIVVWDGTAGDDLVGLGDADGDGDKIDDAGNDIRLIGGNDNLSAGDGSDTIAAGAGDDSIFANQGDDLIDVGDGNDMVFAGSGNDTIDGGTGDDNLNGDADDDSLDGGAGNDSVGGGDGNDTMLGGAGNDLLIDGNGANYFDGGTGDDTINSYLVYTNNLADTIAASAGSGNDTVHFFEFGTDVIEFNGLTAADITIDDQRATASDKRVVVSWGTADSLTFLDWEDDASGADIDYYLLAGSTYTPPTKADLVIGSLSAAETALDLYEPLDLTLTVSNIGTPSASGLTTFYWSDDATLDGATDVVISTYDPGDIAGVSSVDGASVRLTYKMIDKANGDATDGYIFAVVDAGGLIAEDDETNNVSSALAVSYSDDKPAGTNFYIAEIAATDTSLSAGQDMKVNLRVENSGGDKGEAESYYFWSEDNIFGNGNDVLISADSHETLWGGESDGTEPTYLSYDVLSSYGDGFIFAVIDPLNSVDEIDETDNVSAALAFTVAAPGTAGSDAPADFEWVKFDPARDYFDDDHSRNKTNWKIVNNGETEARANFTVFWSEDANYDPGLDVALPVSKGTKLDAGETDYGKVTLRYSQVEAYGDGYLFAVLDPDNLVAESDETNNVSDAIWVDVG